MAVNALPNPVELSSLPEIDNPEGFWIFGSKTNGDGTFASGKYLLDDLANYVQGKSNRIRTPVYRLLGSTWNTFIGERLLIYYVKGYNVNTLKLNGADVPLNQQVSVDIPIDTLMTIEITKLLTDAEAHLYIFALTDSDIPMPAPPTQGIPAGLIAMYKGPVNQIPGGWALCDGQDGRPDLRGTFIVGYNPDDSDYNQIGKIGGTKKKALVTNNIPEHYHLYSSTDDDWNAGGIPANNGIGIVQQLSGNGSDGNDNHTCLFKTSPAGKANPDPVDIRPSYYTLAYIIKL